jgi:hypothetical protein
MGDGPHTFSLSEDSECGAGIISDDLAGGRVVTLQDDGPTVVPWMGDQHPACNSFCDERDNSLDKDQFALF